MRHIENELRRCESELRKAQGERYQHLYAVQQALAWALDPMAYASPVDTVTNGKIGAMDTPVGSADCSAVLRLPQS
jgi:hypothetical protein